MPIRVSCPSCGRILRVPDRLIGEKSKCPACQTQFITSAEESVDENSTYRPAPEELSPVPRNDRAEEYDDDRDDRDDWDEDFRRRRRRRRRASRESASGQLLGPAIGLLSTAILGLLLGVICLIVGPVMLGDAQNAEEKSDAIQAIIAGPFELIASLIVLIGAIAMLRLKNHGFAMAGSVVAMVPCMSPCCVVGIPFGIWGMVILNRSEIRRAFS